MPTYYLRDRTGIGKKLIKHRKQQQPLVRLFVIHNKNTSELSQSYFRLLIETLKISCHKPNSNIPFDLCFTNAGSPPAVILYVKLHPKGNQYSTNLVYTRQSHDGYKVKLHLDIKHQS